MNQLDFISNDAVYLVEFLSHDLVWTKRACEISRAKAEQIADELRADKWLGVCHSNVIRVREFTAA